MTNHCDTASILLRGFAFAAPAALVASATSCSSQKSSEKSDEKPLNIVYIMTDDHTAQMMSCYDSTYANTPNLDRIAADGVRFTNSFVANSLSGPSRACMLTGKHSHKNGFTDNTTCVFDNTQPTFPKYLQQAGYQTAVFGKWHLEGLPPGLFPPMASAHTTDRFRPLGDSARPG